MSCDDEPHDTFDDEVPVLGGFTCPEDTFEDGTIFEATEFGFFAPEGAEGGGGGDITCWWSMVY